MKVLTPHLDRQGRISYRYDKGTQEYLCGMRFKNDKGWIEYVAYWGEDPTLAINVFDLCKVWGPIADNYKASPNTTLETLVGCTSSKETCRPWRMYVNGQQTVYLSSMGLSLQQETYEEATPKWLHAATRPAAPILVKQSPEEWAFKMGTLCGDVVAPNWSAIGRHSGYVWITCYLAGDYHASETLNAYFRLGTHCKVGTPYNLVRYTDKGVQLSTTPLTTVRALCCA